MLGSILAAGDSTTHRVVLVSNISATERQIIRSAGWKTHEIASVSPLLSLLYSEDSERATAELTRRIYGRPDAPIASSSLVGLWQRIARKIALFDLPYDRVMFFDADHVPLITMGTPANRTLLQLHKLWRRREPVVAQRERKPLKTSVRCFNSGHILVYPSRERLHERGGFLDTFIRYAASMSPADPAELSGDGLYAKSKRRCRGTDQPLLNCLLPAWSEFGHSWERSFRELMSNCEYLRTKVDSFHFFHNGPWLEDDACLERAIARRTVPCTKPRHDANGSIICPLVPDFWWGAFNRLSKQTRRACLANFHVDRCRDKRSSSTSTKAKCQS